MRAIVFDGPGDAAVLQLREVAAPELTPGAVRLKVHATAVNRADILQRRGLYPAPKDASPILGLECAGEIVELGAGVQTWQRGDQVMALLTGGGYAEEVVVPAGQLLPIPDAMPRQAAGGFMEVFVTAYSNLFELGGAGPGDTVLVHGGGSGVGTAAIRLGQAAGVRVLVTAGSAEKCRRCLELGAAAAIDYQQEDFLARTRELTSGAGVRVVLDCVGAPYLERNLAALAPDGRLVVIGLQGGAKAELDLAKLLTRRISVVGSALRSRAAADKAAIIAGLQRRFGAALAQGALNPVVHEVVPLAEARPPPPRGGPELRQGHPGGRLSPLLHFGRSCLESLAPASLPKEMKMASKNEVVVVASKVKDVVKAAGCQSSGDLVEGISDRVHEMVKAAVARAKANGRATVRPYDL